MEQTVGSGQTLVPRSKRRSGPFIPWCHVFHTQLKSFRGYRRVGGHERSPGPAAMAPLGAGRSAEADFVLSSFDRLLGLFRRGDARSRDCNPRLAQRVSVSRYGPADHISTHSNIPNAHAVCGQATALHEQATRGRPGKQNKNKRELCKTCPFGPSTCTPLPSMYPVDPTLFPLWYERSAPNSDFHARFLRAKKKPAIGWNSPTQAQKGRIHPSVGFAPALYAQEGFASLGFPLEGCSCG